MSESNQTTAGKSGGPEPCVRLRNVYLHVTKACNLNCLYCYFSAKKPMPDELSAGEFEALWPQLVKLRPRNVVLTGGEPLLRKDLLDLLRGLAAADSDHFVKRSLNTNGHLITEPLAEQLVGLADEVRVSLDGMQKRNDALRGRGNFDAAFRALKTLYKVGFEPKVMITITAEIVDDLEELICLLHDNNLTRISLNNFRPIGRGKGKTDLRPDNARKVEALERAWRRCYPNQPPPTEPQETEQCSCGVGQFLNILPNGDVFPCHVLTQPEFRCGNIRNQRLEEICRQSGILGSLSSLDFREIATSDPDLATLKNRGVCMGNVYAETKESSAWSSRLPIIY